MIPCPQIPASALQILGSLNAFASFSGERKTPGDQFATPCLGETGIGSLGANPPENNRLYLVGIVACIHEAYGLGYREEVGEPISGQFVLLDGD